MRYKKEEIRVALEKYKETESVAETIRILGYPSVSSLHQWIRQHQESKGSFPFVDSERKKYTSINTQQRPLHPPLEFKLDIIKRCFEQGEEIKQVSFKTGYSRPTTYKWYWTYKKQGAVGFMNKRKYKDLPRGPLTESSSVLQTDV